ncbi:SERTA domain-containing protein 3 isoform X2 [Hippocampus comes]|nr:PREDICTED: cell division cycle-associated protein 4-like isoform X2 [Hippocampus comes]XP_019716822.1 PREDICTED: cell division cycle-associated protein 4-like isoform X2 [Hippocampus comes]XP_019716823.1 PREDICTED: cell division cycle-associated protein 4-like isoform X2 [Hippocampus comes]XP_019716824.1 PREDICTED: cell division cycle-associated protein 4-like isoform X2 [Hippocampus comes]XP_019716826.1 PREDICTED: cell division cycle-associated protein 4-like isoform X2 [Hippocampus comes]
MIMKTHKRKLQPESSDECPGGSCGGALAWERQRQFVFSVSLHKYQLDQELPEPSLRRSVLISNTLRQVEACRVPSHERAPPSLMHAPHEQLRATGVQDLPSPAKCQRVASSRASFEEAEDWSSLSADPDFTISPAVSSILTGLDSSLDASAPLPQLPSPRAALRSLENLQTFPDAGGFWLRQQVRGAHSQDLMEWEAGVEAARSSYLTDITAEDMFQDIDTSQLERDMGILGLRGDGCPPAEDLPYHSAKGLPSFSSFSSPPTSFRDGLDLEHLVTMLVES